MYVKIFKGSIFTKPSSSVISPTKASTKVFTKTSPKIITFDLDETLGSFGELYLLWRIIQPEIPSSMNISDVFRELFEMYPECLRPGILPILEFLHSKKKTGECSRVFLYTNNQCPTEWVQFILQYFEEKMPKLFDQAVCAFKIGNQRIEPLRTTHSKTYSDLIRCTLLPKNAELCFIDNSYHQKMNHDRVYYIQPRSYEHGLSSEDIIQRFMTKWKMFPIPKTIEPALYAQFDNLPSSPKGKEEWVVSQKIMYHLKEYFLLSTKVPKTKKIGWNLGRFTRKKR
jgi:hypothetical protein